MRRQGITPIHLYGKGTPSLNLQVDSALLRRLVLQAGGNTPVSVSVKGTSDDHFAFIREVQRHPVTGDILHVDFYQVPTAEVMRADVPIYLTGEAPAVRLNSGVLSQALHSIKVECLPLDVPPRVEVDVSGLEDFQKAIYISSINLGDSVTILNEPNELIVRVSPPRVVVEEEAPTVAEAVEEAEGIEAPERSAQEEA